MHLLAIFLQYLLGRISSKPQTQPAVARARRAPTQAEERQAYESTADGIGLIDARIRATILSQAMRSEKRLSETACRAEPEAPCAGIDRASAAAPETFSASDCAEAFAPPKRA